MNTLETILNAPDNTLVPVSWVRENFLPEPDPELIAYRLAIATAGAFYAAIARGDIPRVLWSRGVPSHLNVQDDQSNPPEPMSKQFSKTIGDYGCSVRIYTRKDSSFYYLDYIDHNGKRMREPMLDPLTGFKITNQQIAIDTAKIMAANLLHESAAVRFRERGKDLDPDTIQAILGPGFARAVPEGVRAISQAVKLSIHKDESDPSNIRLEEAFDRFGSMKPQQGTKSRNDAVTTFSSNRNGALEFFGDIPLSAITPSKLFAYEESLRGLADGTRYQKLNLLARLFRHFSRLVPSLKELEVEQVSRECGSGKRYSEEEFQKLENNLSSIHPDAGDLFHVMTHNGWRVEMGSLVESREVSKHKDDEGNVYLVLRVAIEKVKETTEVSRAIRRGHKAWSFLVIEPRSVEILLRRAALAPNGYLFSIEDGKPNHEPRSSDWFRDELCRLEEIVGIEHMEGRSCHAFKREFGSRYANHPLVQAFCRTAQTLIAGTYSEGGERAFAEGLKSMNLKKVE